VDNQLEELREQDMAYLNAVEYVSSQRLGWVIGLCGCPHISVAPTRGGPAQQCRSRQLPDPTLVQRVLVQTQPHPHLSTSPLVTASQPDLSLSHSAKAAKARSHPHRSSRHCAHRCSFPTPVAFSRLCLCSGTRCSQSGYEWYQLHVAMGNSTGKEV